MELQYLSENWTLAGRTELLKILRKVLEYYQTNRMTENDRSFDDSGLKVQAQVEFPLELVDNVIDGRF